MDLEPTQLVYIDEYDLLGDNYYWRKRESYEISIEELIACGMPDERVRVHKEIIEPLIQIDKEFQNHGYKLYISEGLRPEALYNLIYEKRVKKFGQEKTDKLVNMKSKPHATGKSVDVILYDIKNEIPLVLRNRSDGDQALFLDFYKDKFDSSSKKFQELQELVIYTMMKNGFRIGHLKEYFHFNYDPSSEPNYPLL